VEDPTTGGQIPPEQSNLAPKWLLNGFPKSGLHYAELMMRPLAHQMPAGQMRATPFVGTFAGNSFTTEWADTELFMYHVSGLKPGHYFWSHVGWQYPVEAFLYYLGVAHIVIYRDLRDVAVSQAHHVLSDDEILAHPDKELYRNLGGFDEALEAVIVGIDRYPGVAERWGHWAPWLEADWVYPFQFERARQDPHTVAAEMLEYGIGRSSAIFGYNLKARGPSFDVMVDKMVESSERRELSTTFRKGEVGNWREAFTEKHKRLFKENDRDDWLIKLGYENDRDW
jgi:hypothetical protein